MHSHFCILVVRIFSSNNIFRCLKDPWYSVANTSHIYFVVHLLEICETIWSFTPSRINHLAFAMFLKALNGVASTGSAIALSMKAWSSCSSRRKEILASRLHSWRHPPTDLDHAAHWLPSHPIKCRTTASNPLRSWLYALPAGVKQISHDLTASTRENQNFLGKKFFEVRIPSKVSSSLFWCFLHQQLLLHENCVPPIANLHWISCVAPSASNKLQTGKSYFSVDSIKERFPCRSSPPGLDCAITWEINLLLTQLFDFLRFAQRWILLVYSLASPALLYKLRDHVKFLHRNPIAATGKYSPNC